MKSKIFKPMAVALTMAVGLGTTAMAASVTTTTNYTYGAADNAMVEVATNITGAIANSQVTFLVANGDVSDNGSIVYIDQAGTGNGTTVDFTFKAKQNDLYNANVVAKFGTDNTANTDLKAFKFFDGVDYITNGTAQLELVGDVELDSEVGYTFAIVGKISGDVKEYGLRLKNKSDSSVIGEFPAYASENGVFAVTVNYGDSTEYTLHNCAVELYAYDSNGNEVGYNIQ